MKRARVFFFNAVLLTATSLIMRTVGVSFNVYISNKIGTAGMGLFTLVMSVYSLAVTFATSGINLAATRMTAEALGKDLHGEVRAAMKRCLTYCLCFGVTAAVILYSFSDFIGCILLDDIRTVSSLRLLAVSLPFISLSSALSGYFNAVRRVYKNALAQAFEQLTKIVLTSFGLITFLPKGLEYGCLAVVGGAALAELTSFLFLFILYISDRYKHIRSEQNSSDKLTAKMLKISIPVALSAYVRSGLLTIEHLLVPYGLKRYGSSSERALESYGVLHGMVMPIILFPQAFLSAFSSLLVPEIAEGNAQGDRIRTSYIVQRVFQITLCFSIGTSGIMICFAHELGESIYSNAEAAKFILMMAPLIPVMYLDSAVDSMLKGMNQQLYSMRVNIVDSALSTVLVYTLLPIYGINGYVYIIIGCEILNASLSICRLMNTVDFRINIIRLIVSPILCIAGAASAVKLFFTLGNILIASEAIEVTVHIACTAILYVILLRSTGSVNGEDSEWIKKVVFG